jgi:hypothetical protein
MMDIPTGYTPGPWDDGIHHAQTKGGRTYAHVCAAGLVPVACVPVGVEGYGIDEGRANTRLIALAPDMAAEIARLTAAVAAETKRADDAVARAIAIEAAFDHVCARIDVLHAEFTRVTNAALAPHTPPAKGDA